MSSFICTLILSGALLFITPHILLTLILPFIAKLHFLSFPNHCPAICCVLEWSLNKTHSEWPDMAHKKGGGKHVINHKSFRPERQTYHHSIRLLHFYYPPPILAACFGSFHTVSHIFVRLPSLRYSLTLSVHFSIYFNPRWCPFGFRYFEDVTFSYYRNVCDGNVATLTKEVIQPLALLAWWFT